MSNAIDEVIKSLEDCKKENYTEIHTERFLDYVCALKAEEENIDDKDLAHQNEFHRTRYAAECALHQEGYRAQCKSNLEMFKSTILSGQNALKTGLLLNGGAAIAVLAFIGNIANNHKYMLPDLAGALVWFALGALIMGIAAFLTYAVQRIYQKSENFKDIWQQRGDILNWVIVVLGIIAIVFFYVGARYAYSGITSKKQLDTVITDTRFNKNK